MRYVLIWIGWIVLALAACSSQYPGTPESPLSPQMTPSDVLSERPPGGEPEEAVILFQRSGGFRGITEGWAIYSDGRIVADDGRELYVEPAQVEEVLNEAEAIGFFQMQASYVPLDTCCDRFLYTLTVRDGDRLHTVRLLDGAEAPQKLWDLLEAVQELITHSTTP